MKRILAGLGLATLAVAGLSACNSAPSTPKSDPVVVHSAPAQPDNEDHVFADTVRNQVTELDGVPDADVVKIGKAICEDFDNGTTFQQEADGFKGMFSPYNAGYLIGASVAVYCPEHTDVIPGS